MKGLRLLNNGKWNKPPVLTAARQILVQGLRNFTKNATLGDMADFVNGTSYNPSELNETGTPIIRISNISNPQSVYLKTQEKFDEKFQVSTGDLLVSWSASFKSIIWQETEGILNQHIFKVTEKAGFHRGFIRHLIEAVFDEMQENVVGIGMMHLRRADFLGHIVPMPEYDVQIAVSNYLDWYENQTSELPPKIPDFLEEQKRIVARVENLAAQIAEARGLREKTEKARKVLMSALITKVLTDTAITGYLSDVMLDKPRNGWSAIRNNEIDGIPILSLGAVTGFKYKNSEFKRTLVTTNPESHYWLKTGDLLMSRSNTPDLVGHAAIYDGTPSPCIYPDLMMRLELNLQKTTPKFVHWWLQASITREYIKQHAKGTSPTMKKITQGVVMKIPFPIGISLENQEEIIQKLETLEFSISSLKQFQEATRLELNALLPSVLSKAFAGEL
jgi:restriction endonuclease S subunit